MGARAFRLNVVYGTSIHILLYNQLVHRDDHALIIIVVPVDQSAGLILYNVRTVADFHSEVA